MRKLQSCGFRVAFGMTATQDSYIHDVTPKVVAIAVKMVMAMWMIFFQISCLFMVMSYEL